MSAQIVFVLGTTRSGTSAIRNALCQTRYKGPGEGHFIGLLQTFDRVVAEHYLAHTAAREGGTMISDVPEHHLKSRIHSLLLSLYTEIFKSEFIVDKTPTLEPLLALSNIQGAWPSSRFIFCRRRGIDNVLSKQRKFPGEPFVNHCREWTAIIDHWDAHKWSLRSKWIEVEHYDLAHDPASSAKSIARLLDLSIEEQTNIEQYFSLERPDQTGSGAGFVPLSETGWSPEQINVFVSECGGAMARCGYDTQAYWRRVDPDNEV